MNGRDSRKTLGKYILLNERMKHSVVNQTFKSFATYLQQLNWGIVFIDCWLFFVNSHNISFNKNIQTIVNYHFEWFTNWYVTQFNPFLAQCSISIPLENVISIPPENARRGCRNGVLGKKVVNDGDADHLATMSLIRTYIPYLILKPSMKKV